MDVAGHMLEKADVSIELGISNVGLYHAERPLILKGDEVIIQNMNTLYYYHNRMTGYGLENQI